MNWPSEIDDLLVDGEKVMWSGTPDPMLMKPLASYWRRKLVHFLWIAAFAVLAVALGYVGNSANVQGMLEVVLGVVIVIIVIALIVAVIAFLDFKDEATQHQHDYYAITDRRLIVVNSGDSRRQYIFPNSVSYVSNNTNNTHRTLSIAHGNAEGEDLLMHGLPDAEFVEKLIVEKFSMKTGEK